MAEINIHEHIIPKAVKLVFYVGDINVCQGGEFSITGGDINPDKLEYSLDNDILKVSYTEKSFPRIVHPTLKITFPTENCESFSLDAKAGKFSVNGICAKEFSACAAAGELVISDCKAFEKTTIRCDAGSMKAYTCDFRNCGINNGVGEVLFENCKITGNNSVKSGVGKIALSLSGSITDYSFVTKTGLGAALINGQRYNNIITEPKENNFRVETGVGEITININI